MCDLVRSADCNQLNIPHHTHPFQACRTNYSGPFIVLYSLSILGYCRIITVQHDSLEEDLLYLQTLSKVMKIQQFLFSGDYRCMKTFESSSTIYIYI